MPQPDMFSLSDYRKRFYWDKGDITVLDPAGAVIAQDDWNESLHPRGQPENAGEFAKSPHDEPGKFETVGSKLSASNQKLKKLPMTKMRYYTPKELDWEYGVEYNKYAKGEFPNAFASREDFQKKYNSAPLGYLTDDAFSSLGYSYAHQGIGNSEAWLHSTFGKRRDTHAILNALKSGQTAPPIVLKDREHYRLLGGQTRLAAAAVLGYKVPVKLIDVNKAQRRSVTASTSRKVLFEVAPDPADTELSAQWNKISDNGKIAISSKVLHDILPDVLQKTGAKATMHLQYGGYLDDCNPSVSLVLDKSVSDDQADALTRVLGSVLSQQSMARISKKKFKGSTPMDAVVIRVPKNITMPQVKVLYNSLRDTVKGADGAQLINGHTTDAGRMVILIDQGTGERIARMVDQRLNGEYEVGHDTLNVAWPEKGDTDYGLRGESGLGKGSTGSSIRQWCDSVRATASKIRQQGIAEYQAQESGSQDT